LKDLFSKILNWVTFAALGVWLFLNAIVFFFPDQSQFIFEMDEKLIWAIVGAVIGAGGYKIKTLTDGKTSEAEYQVDTAPTSNDYE